MMVGKAGKCIGFTSLGCLFGFEWRSRSISERTEYIQINRILRVSLSFVELWQRKIYFLSLNRHLRKRHVIQYPTHSTHCHIHRSTITRDSIIRCLIHTACKRKIPTDADISKLSPRGCPRVANDPIIPVVGVASISDQLNDVVDIGIGHVTPVKYSAFVCVPRGGIDIYGKRPDKREGSEDESVVVGGKKLEAWRRKQ